MNEFIWRGSLFRIEALNMPVPVTGIHKSGTNHHQHHKELNWKEKEREQ